MQRRDEPNGLPRLRLFSVCGARAALCPLVGYSAGGCVLEAGSEIEVGGQTAGKEAESMSTFANISILVYCDNSSSTQSAARDPNRENVLVFCKAV